MYEYVDECIYGWMWMDGWMDGYIMYGCGKKKEESSQSSVKN